MKEIIFFSNNNNKIKEVKNLFSTQYFNLYNLNNYKKIKSPEETGKSFSENAKIKSLYGFQKFNKICFADDSGLCVKALNNGPGINSKNYLEKHKNKKEALKKIILASIKKNNFSAYFKTSICLTLNYEKNIFFDGKVEGIISKEIMGEDGFGYDPIFIPNGYKETFAQMDLNTKNQISHRYIAIKKLKNYLINLSL